MDIPDMMLSKLLRLLVTLKSNRRSVHRIPGPHIKPLLAGQVNLMFWTDENSDHSHVVCFFLEN